MGVIMTCNNKDTAHEHDMEQNKADIMIPLTWSAEVGKAELAYWKSEC